MQLSEIILRRQIRRILAEEVSATGGSPTSTATDASPPRALTGQDGKKTIGEKLALGFLSFAAISTLIKKLFGDEDESGGGGGPTVTELKALLCGDSQAQGSIGDEVEKTLESQGYKVTRNSKKGAKPEEVKGMVAAGLSDNPLLVVAILGGNGTVSTAKTAVEEIQALCDKEGATLLVIGPPKSTKITNLKIAQQKFGTSVKDSNHWVNLAPSDSKSPDGRKAISDNMQTAKRPDGEFVKVYGVASQYADYPDQPDGIHCDIDADNVVTAAMTFFNIGAITTSLKDALDKAKQPQRKKRGRERQLSSSADTEADMLAVAMGDKDADTQISDMRRYGAGIIAAERSNAKIDTYNPGSGASGKYQFVPSENTPTLLVHIKDRFDASTVAAAEAEYAEVVAGRKKFRADYYNNPSSAIRKCWDHLLTDEDLQDAMLGDFTQKHVKKANEFKRKYPNNNVVQALSVAQMVCAMHLHGAGGFESQVIRDRYYGPPKFNGKPTVNAPVPVYINRFSAEYYGTSY